jgi:16S rRNA G966 N2-methylase RsmD
MAWKEPFNVIFLDPPFDYPHKQQLLERLCTSRLLAPFCKVLMHYPDENTIPHIITAPDPMPGTPPPSRSPRALTLYDQRVYGRSVVHFYQANLLEDKAP